MKNVNRYQRLLETMENGKYGIIPLCYVSKYLELSPGGRQHSGTALEES